MNHLDETLPLFPTENINNTVKISIPSNKKENTSQNNKTTTIVVSGIDSRVGCTHFSINLASFLSRKFKTALINISTKDDISYLDRTVRTSLSENSFSLNGIDFYYHLDLFEKDSKTNSYDFLIFDSGRLVKKDPSEKITISKNLDFIKENDANFLICNSKPWELNNLQFLLNNSNDPRFAFLKNAGFIFNLTDKDTFLQFSCEIKGYKMFHLPYNPGLFEISREMKEFLPKLLNSVSSCQKPLKFVRKF